MRERNPVTHEEKLSYLRELREEAVNSASEEAVEKQHAKGKMTARERIEKLLDPGSFEELDTFVRHRTYDFEMQKNKIQLYSRQVFITDEVKDVVPDFLMMLHGVLDSPDIPLNVSRSYLQSDANVKKISQHITKKVADKLSELYKKDRQDFEKKWDEVVLVLTRFVRSPLRVKIQTSTGHQRADPLSHDNPFQVMRFK